MTLPGTVPDSVGVYHAASGIALALILSTTVIMRWNRMIVRDCNCHPGIVCVSRYGEYQKNPGKYVLDFPESTPDIPNH